MVADSAGNGVQVLLNNGDGTFAVPVKILDGRGPVAVILADLDNDGHLDIVVADAVANKLAILMGAGDGTFGAPIFYGTGPAPGWIGAQDLSGDGKPDLVTANYSDGSVSVFANSGGGVFVPSQRVFPAYGSYDTVIMDVAGKAQLVSANVSAGAVVVTPPSVNTTGSSGTPPVSTTHRIQGAQDPQSSSGSGARPLQLGSARRARPRPASRPLTKPRGGIAVRRGSADTFCMPAPASSDRVRRLLPAGAVHRAGVAGGDTDRRTHGFRAHHRQAPAGEGASLWLDSAASHCSCNGSRSPPAVCCVLPAGI